MSRFFTLFLLLSASVNAATDSRNHTNNLIPVSDALPAGYSRLSSDTIPPIINCPPGDTVVLASGRCDTNYLYVVTAFDGLTEIVPTLEEGWPSGHPLPIGTTVNVFQALDTSGNTASCSFSILVVPASSSLVCADTLTVYLGPGCTVTPALEQLLVEPYGCLSEDHVAEVDKTDPPGNGPWLPTTFGAADVNQTYIFRVADTSSTNKCLGIIQVADSLVLVLDCPEINVPCALPMAHLSPEFLKDSLEIAAGMPTILQTCPSAVSTLFIDVATDVPCDSPGTVSGYIRRFWTVVDSSNNAATCVQTINRNRNIADILYPADTTVSCSGADPLPETTGEPYILFGSRQYPLSESPLCEIEATYTDSAGALCGGSHRLYRTWTIRDTCSTDSTQHTVTGLQHIDVLDMDGPTFQCPADTAVSIQTTDCKGTLELPGIIVGDGCSRVTAVTAYWTINGVPDSLEATLTDFPGNDPTATDTLAAFDTVADFPAGVTQIVYVATDDCGNTASCEIALSVGDSIPPIALCDSFLVVTLDTTGRFSLPADTLDNGSSDSCSTVAFKVRRLETNGCQPVNRFFNAADFCCADVGDTILVQLRAYDVLLPAGEVDTAFSKGQSADCSTLVVVRDTFPASCQAPPDVTITCDSFDLSLAAYGDATPSCGIDSMTNEVDFAQFDSTCNTGSITRTFTVFKTGGPDGQCVQQIQVDAAQNYWIKFPNDTIVTMCDTAGIYGAPELGNLSCEKIKITYTDDRITDVPDACLKILRTWTIVNECVQGHLVVIVPNPGPNMSEIHPDNLPGPVVSPVGTPDPWAPTRTPVNPTDPDSLDYSIFWNPDAHGYTYEQVIFIIDSEAPVVENCPANAPTYEDFSSNDAQLWNDSYTTIPGGVAQDLCEGEPDLSLDVTDACYGADVDVRYLLFLDLDGDGAPETVIKSDNPPSAGDVLYNNIATPNYNGGVPKSMDNRQIPANAKYQFAVQHIANGFQKTIRVVWNTPSNPLDFVLPQLPLGNHRIEWTVSDGCGNEATCAYDFALEDAGGLCAPTQLPVSGLIRTEMGAGVNAVAVAVDGTHPTLPPFNLFDLTDDQGAYDFVVPTGGDFYIKPYRDDSPLNGVSTFDLLLINKHVLGLELLPSAYKLVAADANRSNTVTTFDIVELRKLLLGITQELPNNSSWRFVDAKYLFPNQPNPLQGGFPDSVFVADMQPWTPSMYDFVGVKVGDVNESADPGFAGQVLEDRSTMTFTLDDALLRPGETVRIAIRPEEKTGLQGMQFAFRFDPDVLAVQRIIPGFGAPAFDQFYAQPAPGVLTLSWDDANGAVFGAADPVFYLEIKALQPVQLSRAMELYPGQLRPEVYLADGKEIRALRFEFATAPAVLRTEIFPASPNPSAGPVYIPVALAAAETVHLVVFDQMGRQVYVVERVLPAGMHRIEIPAEALGHTAGVLMYRVRAGAVVDGGKIIR